MFFGAISVLNSIFVILYLTGKPKPEDDFHNKHEGAFFSLQALTILNITASSSKVLLCYINCMITITALTFYMIINYTIKFKGH